MVKEESMSIIHIWFLKRVINCLSIYMKCQLHFLIDQHAGKLVKIHCSSNIRTAIMINRKLEREPELRQWCPGWLSGHKVHSVILCWQWPCILGGLVLCLYLSFSPTVLLNSAPPLKYMWLGMMCWIYDNVSDPPFVILFWEVSKRVPAKKLGSKMLCIFKAGPDIWTLLWGSPVNHVCDIVRLKEFVEVCCIYYSGIFCLKNSTT